MNTRPRIVKAILTASVLAGVVGQAGFAAGQDEATESKRFARELSAAFRFAAQEVLPAVVTIQKKPEPITRREQRRVPQRNPFEGTPFEDMFRENDPLYEFFRELPDRPRRRGVGMGSGVIVDPSGVILTNNHVVEGDGTIEVQLSDGRTFEATRVETDPRTDLAVVWIDEAGPLKSARLGNSDELEIGDWVLAVGHPFGLFQSVTAGIISAKGRGIGVAMREDFIQTDAAINPGNSGGPLINLEGEVVGINTAISSRTGGYQGAGFAIPINLAKWVSEQLVKTGTVRRAYLGTEIGPVTAELAEQFGVDVNNGALVTHVIPESPADEGGIEPGDVVVEFGDKRVKNPHDLVAAVERASIGERQRVEVIRDGQRRTLGVTVKLQPKNYGMARLRRRANGFSQDSDRMAYERWGLEIGPLAPEAAEQLGLPENAGGVLITDVSRSGPARLAGLSAGMVILQVNRRPVTTPEQFDAIISEADDQQLLLLVRTRSGSRFVVLETGS